MPRPFLASNFLMSINLAQYSISDKKALGKQIVMSETLTMPSISSGQHKKVSLNR